MLTISYRVKGGNFFTKWGNKDDNLLNWVVSVSSMKLGVKTGNYSKIKCSLLNNWQLTSRVRWWFSSCIDLFLAAASKLGISG